MTLANLAPTDLALTIAPEALGFADTFELLQQPLPWIGQERAETAARFGLTMDQPDYNLFVLGEVGSGRSTLLQQVMREVAATRQVPPDLCYLHNFDAPEKPRALRLPPGQGKLLRQLMAQMSKTLQKEIPQRLVGPDFKAESAHIEKTYKLEEAKAYAELDAFAEARNFALYRENGHLVFTLLGAKGNALTESEARSLPKEKRAQIDQAEQELHAEITRFLDKTRPIERVMNEGLAALRRQIIKPLLEHELQGIRLGLKKQIKDSVKLGNYLDQVMHDVLDNLDVFRVADVDADDELRLEELAAVLSRLRVNLVVDNDGLTGAPVIIEDNPSYHSLFGSIEYQAEEDVLLTDFSRIRAGSLLKAHGGFLMLHVRDLLADELVWEKLRRFSRTGRLQIEEPMQMMAPMATVSLTPEALDLSVKIVLIGATEEYYLLQEADPEFARRFRVKVDFAESFAASAQTYAASSVFVSHTCQRLGLPHFTAAAVAQLLQDAHREVDDQTRQSATFARMEALVMEAAAVCQARGGTKVDGADVSAALQARQLRHNYPDQRMQETITDGERLISLQGEKTGQINGLTQIDLGDYRFGFPVRVTAHTSAGED
ncbi:MAG: ATP-dependent protease, partial [Betaproteobacteria bacterium HGW-Betaproteobacteria-18]